MKSYTDIEQSSKLAEILPIESADMHYNVVGDVIIGDYQRGISSARSVAKAYKKNPDEFAKSVTPCWSLATLLSVLPEPILTQFSENKWNIAVFDEDNHFKDECFADEPVDACYEMILKLHEQKLL